VQVVYNDICMAQSIANNGCAVHVLIKLFSKERNEVNKMARDFNHFAAIGRLGKDPELKTTENGKSYLDFSIANNQDASSDNTHTVWIDCRVWGNTAEVLAKYCKKGNRIAVEGQLDTSSYTNRDGQHVTRTFINVRHFYFCENKTDAAVTPTYDVEAF